MRVQRTTATHQPNAVFFAAILAAGNAVNPNIIYTNTEEERSAHNNLPQPQTI